MYYPRSLKWVQEFKIVVQKNNNRFQSNKKEPKLRVNERITTDTVRLIDEKGENLGVINTQEAIQKATEAGLDFLVDDGVTDDSLSYCMVFVQKLSKLDDAALYLEKSNYYEHFPEDIYDALVLDRRRLRNGNGQSKDG